MKLKITDTLNFNRASATLMATKLPLQCAYKLSKIQKVLTDDVEFYQSKYAEIIEKYGLVEDGKLKTSEDGQTIMLQPDKIQECQEEIAKLNSLEVTPEVDEYLLNVEDFGNVEISLEDMSGLIPFIK